MPELEAVEVNVTNIFFDRDVMTSLSSKKVPDSLKTMIEGLRKMEEEGDDEVDLARPKSGAREPKEEFPRPLSQVKPLILPLCNSANYRHGNISYIHVGGLIKEVRR